MSTKPQLTTRLLSSILCGALLLTCPGPNAYAAAGQIVSAQVNVPVGIPIGAGLARTSFSGTLDARQTRLRQHNRAGSVLSRAPSDRRRKHLLFQLM